MIYPALQHGAWELSTFKAIIFRFEIFWLSVLPSTVDDPTIERIPFKVEHLGASYILEKMTNDQTKSPAGWSFIILSYELSERER